MKVDNNGPSTRLNTPVGPQRGGAPINAGITGAEARLNSEAAFDAAFAVQAGVAEAAVAAAVGATPLGLSPEANVALAITTLTDIEAVYLAAPPSGPIADGFTDGVPKEAPPAVKLEGADVALPVTLATGLLPKLLPQARPAPASVPAAGTEVSHLNLERQDTPVDSRSELGRALSKASDKVWDKVIASFPSPTNPQHAPIFNGLQKPEAQRLVASIQPLAARMVEGAGADKGKAGTRLNEGEKKKLEAGLSNLASMFDGDVDIVALVTIVLMECHRDKGQDVKDLISDIRADNKKKEGIRKDIRAYKQQMAEVNTKLRTAYQEALRRGDIDPKVSFDEFAAGATIAWPTGANENGTLGNAAILSPPADYYASGVAGEASEPDAESLRQVTQAGNATRMAADDRVNTAKKAVSDAEAAVKKADADRAAFDAPDANGKTGWQRAVDAERARLEASGADAGTQYNGPLEAGNAEMDKIYGAQTDAQKALDAAKQELSNAETERDAQRAQAKAEADKAAADAARAAADATTAQAEALAAQTSANAQLAKARADAINGQLQGGTGNTPTQTKKSAFPPPVDKNLVKLPANTRMGSLEEMKEFVSAQQDKLDSLGDIAMEKQMRLQMYMDAYAQTASMISNVQKKASETATTIIGNMK